MNHRDTENAPRTLTENDKRKKGMSMQVLLSSSLLVFSVGFSSVISVPLWFVPFAPPESPGIRLNKAAFEVTGLDAADLKKMATAERTAEQWNALFAIYVDRGPAKNATPPVLGSHVIKDGLLRFEPRFPLEPGVRYRAVFDSSRLSGKANGRSVITAEFVVPKPPSVATTEVRHVYPTRNKLPENQLKFYLHFSAPMSQGDSYRRIHLLNAAGKEVLWAFLELEQELWDPAGTRFTLLLDPGRIKRGLKPREELGPALEEGKSYTLVIDREWLDAEGNPLRQSYRKVFRVGPPDDVPLDPKTWKLEPPAAGDRKPLVVVFPEPLDHALMDRLLHVTDDAGRRLPGTATITDEETRWRFTPERPWQSGRYHLVTQTILEDLAGNRVGEPFEVAVFRPVQKEIRTEKVKVPFVVRN